MPDPSQLQQTISSLLHLQQGLAYSTTLTADANMCTSTKQTLAHLQQGLVLGQGSFQGFQPKNAPKGLQQQRACQLPCFRCHVHNS